jgi:hypothetical protein
MVLGVGGAVRVLSAWVAVLVFLVSQFPSKEEEMALLETVQQMRVQLYCVQRRERMLAEEEKNDKMRKDEVQTINASR